MATNDELVKQITAAVGAHGLWKQRLTGAIKTHSKDLDATTVKKDDQCDFGKWLRVALPTMSGDMARSGQQVRDLHSRFHVQAADVVKLAGGGQSQAAQQAMDGPYSTASAELTKAMIDWKAQASRG